jgi:hypothetical protein
MEMLRGRKGIRVYLLLLLLSYLLALIGGPAFLGFFYIQQLIEKDTRVLLLRVSKDMIYIKKTGHHMRLHRNNILTRKVRKILD